MKKWRVVKEYHYTEVIEEIEAETKKEAETKACSMNGERVHDDHLYDCTASEI